MSQCPPLRTTSWTLGATARPPARRKWRGLRRTGLEFRRPVRAIPPSVVLLRTRASQLRAARCGWLARRPGLGAIPRRISTQSPTEIPEGPQNQRCRANAPGHGSARAAAGVRAGDPSRRRSSSPTSADEIEGRHLLGLRLSEPRFQDGGHAREPQLPERPIEFEQIHGVSPVRSMRSR